MVKRYATKTTKICTPRNLIRVRELARTVSRTPSHASLVDTIELVEVEEIILMVSSTSLSCSSLDEI